MSNVVKKPIEFLKKTIGKSGRPLVEEIRAGSPAEASEAAEQRMQRRDRQEGAARAAGLRAARGRGRGYRSLLSQSRMEDQQGKGSKTTLGG